MTLKMKHKLIGLAIVFLLIGLVSSVRLLRGQNKSLEIEPWKIKGNASASVFIVEFSDFACPYCKVIQPVLESLFDIFPNDLKIVYKQYPIKSHHHSYEASEASECAGDQGRFWEYKNLLFDHVIEWFTTKNNNLENVFINYARQVNLDIEKFKTCYESGNKRDIIERNIKEGDNYLVSGTPTLILNGTKIITHTSKEALNKLVSEALPRTGVKTR